MNVLEKMAVKCKVGSRARPRCWLSKGESCAVESGVGDTSSASMTASVRVASMDSNLSDEASSVETVVWSVALMCTAGVSGVVDVIGIVAALSRVVCVERLVQVRGELEHQGEAVEVVS